MVDHVHAGGGADRVVFAEDDAGGASGKRGASRLRRLQRVHRDLRAEFEACPEQVAEAVVDVEAAAPPAQSSRSDGRRSRCRS